MKSYKISRDVYNSIVGKFTNKTEPDQSLEFRINSSALESFALICLILQLYKYLLHFSVTTERLLNPWKYSFVRLLTVEQVLDNYNFTR